MIGIIGAMEEEVAEILKLMDVKQTNLLQDYTFHIGQMNHRDVVLLQGGIGKVNAAIATTLLLLNYDIDYVMNIGSAGGLHMNQNVGDVVISQKVAHHDVDVTAFGRQIGEIPGMPIYFETDMTMLNNVKKILDDHHISSHIGLIVSGDQFISQSKQVKTIQDKFPDAMCVEMEAAAIAQVCHVFNKKFLITRSLSDIFNKGDNSVQFDEYLKKASQVSAQMCYELISIL